MTTTEPSSGRRGDGTTRPDGTVRRLLSGQADFEFVRRSRTWALVSLAVIVVSVLGLAVRGGLNFSIEFTGGTSFVVEHAQADFTSAELREGVTDIVDGDVTAQEVTDAQGRPGALVGTPTLGDVGGPEERAVQARIAEITGVAVEDVQRDSIGPRWGAQVTEQALIALAVFLALVSAYIAIRFEWRMAAAAFVTLLHDIIVTIGVYAIVGFEVSPASVIALLTILGYSLYDTVVVFDRVTEDTRRLGSTSSRTYGELANHALNRVLVRSISTSATSLLPVGCLLFIGGQLLGADTLLDLALALFVGMAVGTYSSIFVATPMLVWLKLRDPEIAEHTETLIARRGGEEAAALARRERTEERSRRRRKGDDDRGSGKRRDAGKRRKRSPGSRGP